MNTPIVTVHQPSMTEWFAAIGEASDSAAFREEDNHKTDRLATLKQCMGLPYRQPVVLPARDVWDEAPVFQEILQRRGDESIAFRLTSKNPGLPKLRSRGMSMRDTYEQWFKKLDIDLDQYQVAIFPNEAEIAWSTIFVVNDEAIFGEIVAGRHVQLSQGESENQPLYFKFDYSKWEWSGDNPAAQASIQEAVASVKVSSKKVQAELKKQLGSRFVHDYLWGYFETTTPANDHTYFIDYNRLQANYVQTPTMVRPANEAAAVKGIPANQGIAEGPVVLVSHDKVGEISDFPAGAILVCDNTDVRYLPLMQKAAAVVTDRGGLLSHAAIITRELRKPCIVGTKNATKILKNGALVRVDGTKGLVIKVAG